LSSNSAACAGQRRIVTSGIAAAPVITDLRESDAAFFFMVLSLLAVSASHNSKR
jgi:hypothetical protein